MSNDIINDGLCTSTIVSCLTFDWAKQTKSALTTPDDNCCSRWFAHRIHNFCCCCGPQCIIIALEGLYGLSLYNNVTVNNWQRGFRILNSAKIQSETVKWLIQNSYVAWMLSASHLLFVGFSIHFVSSISQVNKKKKKRRAGCEKKYKQIGTIETTKRDYYI